METVSNPRQGDDDDEYDTEDTRSITSSSSSSIAVISASVSSVEAAVNGSVDPFVAGDRDKIAIYQHLLVSYLNQTHSF